MSQSVSQLLKSSLERVTVNFITHYRMLKFMPLHKKSKILNVGQEKYSINSNTYFLPFFSLCLSYQ